MKVEIHFLMLNAFNATFFGTQHPALNNNTKDKGKKVVYCSTILPHPVSGTEEHAPVLFMQTVVQWKRMFSSVAYTTS